MAKDLGNLKAIASQCVPALDPAAVVLAVDAVDAAGKTVTVQIAFPASGVQSLRGDLRMALMALPIEERS